MIHGEQWTKQIKKYRPETTAAIATTHNLTKSKWAVAFAWWPTLIIMMFCRLLECYPTEIAYIINSTYHVDSYTGWSIIKADVIFASPLAEH